MNILGTFPEAETKKMPHDRGLFCIQFVLSLLCVIHLFKVSIRVAGGWSRFQLRLGERLGTLYVGSSSQGYIWAI